MPTGKVKWFDPEKGFGFLVSDEGPDVHVRADALPEGVTTLKPGTRVDFDIARGRRGDQALQVRILEPAGSVSRAQSKARRKPPEEIVVIVEDLIGMLDGISEDYRRGRHPEAKRAKPVAQVLRALATELDTCPALTYIRCCRRCCSRSHRRRERAGCGPTD